MLEMFSSILMSSAKSGTLCQCRIRSLQSTSFYILEAPSTVLFLLESKLQPLYLCMCVSIVGVGSDDMCVQTFI